MTHLILSVVAVQPLGDGAPPKWLRIPCLFLRWDGHFLAPTSHERNPSQRTPTTQQKANGEQFGTASSKVRTAAVKNPKSHTRFPSLVHRLQHHLIHPRKLTDSSIQKSGLWPTLAPKLPCPLLWHSLPPALRRNCRTHRGLLQYKKPLIPFFQHQVTSHAYIKQTSRKQSNVF